MRSTARGGLPNSTIDASSSGSADSLPLPPTRSVSSIPGTKKISCTKPRAFDDVAKTVDAVVAGTVRHQQQVRPGDMDEAGIAAARRGIDAAVGADVASTQNGDMPMNFLAWTSISGRAFAITRGEGAG